MYDPFGIADSLVRYRVLPYTSATSSPCSSRSKSFNHPCLADSRSPARPSHALTQAPTHGEAEDDEVEGATCPSDSHPLSGQPGTISSSSLSCRCPMRHGGKTEKERGSSFIVSTSPGATQQSPLPRAQLPRLTGANKDTLRVLQLIFPTCECVSNVVNNKAEDKSCVVEEAACAHTRRNGPDAEAATGQRMLRHVSTTPATREDVVTLHEALRTRLQIRRARLNGDCPIRREIYDDVFRELVRQITIEEPARGMLLQRVWDESKHTLRVHQDMVLHGWQFASRKLLSCQDGVAALRDRVVALQRDKDALVRQRHAMERRLRSMSDRINSERIRIVKEQRDEITYLRLANQQLSVRFKAETERSTNTSINVAC